MRVQHPTSRCSACQAEVGWVVTKNGKKMPVDADTLSDLDRSMLGQVGNTVPYRNGEHRSHFSTCPAAKEFRR